MDTGSTSTGDASIDAGPTQAVAASISIYYGGTAKLDGAASTGPGLTYTWAIASGPPGSAVTALEGASTATPSFTPDRVGIYNLTLQVAGGGATSTIPVTVTVVDPPVFYASFSSGEGATRMNVVGAAFGDAGTPVGCSATDAGNASAVATYSAQFATDIWEAPAGQPSRTVYVAGSTSADASTSTHLYAATSTSSCATETRTLDVRAADPYTARPFEQPRFSPSGERIAYLKNDPMGATVATVGFDGASPRSLGPLYALADGGANPDASTAQTSATMRPVWVDDTTVAWFQALDGSSWRIVKASDVGGATPTVVMTCASAAPTGFAFLPSGEILVDQAAGSGGTAATNLVAYTPDGAKACSAPRAVTHLTSVAGASRAYSFTLSPDGKQVAFLAYDDATDAASRTSARVIGVDGTGPVTLPGFGTEGPRWVGNGAFVAFGDLASYSSDGGALAAIATTTADGGALHAVSVSQGTTRVTAIGNGYPQFCNMGRAFGPGVTLFGVLGVAGLALARRRKRS